MTFKILVPAGNPQRWEDLSNVTGRDQQVPEFRYLMQAIRYTMAGIKQPWLITDDQGIPLVFGDHGKSLGGCTPLLNEPLINISTDHLSDDDRELIHNLPEGFFSVECSRGWFIELPAGYDTDDANRVLQVGLSSFFVELLQYASVRGCRYIFIDTDANVLPGLPTFLFEGLVRREAVEGSAENQSAEFDAFEDVGGGDGPIFGE